MSSAQSLTGVVRDPAPRGIARGELQSKGDSLMHWPSSGTHPGLLAAQNRGASLFDSRACRDIEELDAR